MSFAVAGPVGFWIVALRLLSKNKVQWLHNQNGVHFDGYGQAYSTAPWDLNSNSVPANNGSLSVEIWLRSWEKVYPQVSAIFSVENPARQGNFVIAQSGSDIFVGGQFRDKSDRIGARKLWLAEACRNAEPRFITLISGPEGTTLYLEGTSKKHYPVTLTRESFSGRLLLGHPAAGHQAWTGDLFGLAIYDHALTIEDVAKHYKAWQDARTADVIMEPGVAAFYPFDERSGTVIHNRAGSAPNLVIPKEFRSLHRTLLSPELTFKRSDLTDIMVNIVGFAPFGFFLCAYLRRIKHLGKVRSVLLTIALGGLTSLVIELLQAYLPSRDSSLLDVIDNTLGTLLGAALQIGLPSSAVRRSKIATPA